MRNADNPKHSPASPHFMVLAPGTIGDVFPLIALCAMLRERGNVVTMVAPKGYLRALDGSGVECVSMTGDHPGDTHLLSTRYAELYTNRHVVRWNAVAYKEILARLSPRLVLLTGDRDLLWADTFAHFHHGVAAMRLCIDPPVLPGFAPNRFMIPPTRVQQHLTMAAAVMWRQTASRFGIAVGISHVPKLVKQGLRLIPRIGLFPDWIAREPGRGPVPIRNFGFLRLFPPPEPTAQDSGMSPACPPRTVVFVAGTLGTTGTWSSRFFDAGIKVAERLGVHVRLLGGEPPPCDGYRVRWEAFSPIDHALQGAVAVVHHGGIGTAAAALRCGVPQIIVPRVFTQASNAERLRRLGLACVLPPEKYSFESVRAAIADVQWRQEVPDRPASLDGDPATVAGFLERWAQSTRRVGEDAVFPDAATAQRNTWVPSDDLQLFPTETTSRWARHHREVYNVE